MIVSKKELERLTSKNTSDRTKRIMLKRIEKRNDLILGIFGTLTIALITFILGINWLNM